MTHDSIYPEFFRAGIGKLREQCTGEGDFQGLFSALEHFRRDITGRLEVPAILKATELYVRGLDLFETIALFVINQTSFDFELAHCAPESAGPSLDALVRREIAAGRFAWALRQSAPTFFKTPSELYGTRGVLHTLGVSGQRLGMFCGILKRDRAPSQEFSFSLLSILLGTCSDALAGVRTTAELQNRILAANSNLQRALKDNEILARIPAESPAPVARLDKSGRVVYSNQAGLAVLGNRGWQVGDLITGEWLEMLEEAFARNAKREFEDVSQGRVYAFLIVPISEAGYANFYGMDITARKQAETQREQLIAELQDALAKVKTLSGLVPICAWCKKIRDDRGFWNEVEVYVQHHSDAIFSHGICPQCRQKWEVTKSLPQR
ncbi:MAG: hypothetical protein ACOYM3_29440 [Terrimicrobiaceae bacterium]